MADRPTGAVKPAPPKSGVKPPHSKSIDRRQKFSGSFKKVVLSQFGDFPSLKFSLNTILRRLLPPCWMLLSLTAGGAVDRGRFSDQEIAQGFSNTTVLARPVEADDAAVITAERNEGLEVPQRFAQLRNLRVLRVPVGGTVRDFVTRLRSTGRYAYVEPDRLLHAHVLPSDTSFALQWSFNNTGQNGGTINADIRALTAWDINHDASNIIVGVVDTGIRLTHSELKGNLWSLGAVHGIRATKGNGTYTTDPDDDDGHGTHVAGVIGATGNNSAGIAGVAWKTQMMALKFLAADGNGSTADEVACINYAIANGVSVINGSYGSDTYSTAEFEAIKAARDHSIIFISSAGNDAQLNDTNDDYPGNYALDNIVTVAATTRTDALATYSNYGSGSVDIAAPGSEIYSTYNDSDVAYQTLSGTSMSSPHVTGAVALLKASFPNDTYRQIINRLLRSVTKLSALNGKVQTGGRLNVAQALSPSTANRPFNDGFAERAFVSGPNVRIRSNNTGATSEVGEKDHANVTGTTSLWWSWTAPANSEVAFDTVGSEYDTALAVYTGSTLGTLQLVASNDNATGTTTSRVLINVASGTTYQIAVTGKNNASGYTALRIGTVPANDDFANAKLVTGVSLTESATILNATRESGEKNPTNVAAGHSIWYKWVAPKSGSFVLSAFATGIDTVAAVYTGSTLASLTVVNAQDDSVANPANSDALVPFTAVANTTYYFSIDNSTTDTSAGGDFIMTLTDAAWAYPANDEVTSSPAVGSDGTIYFGAGSDKKTDKNVYAVSSTGVRKWSFATGESGVIGASPALGSDGTVYVGGTDKILYALDGASGAKKWSFTSASQISSTAAVGADGTIYFRDNSKLYALNTDGGQRWSFDLAGSTDGTYCSPAIGADGTVYVGTNGGAFYAISDNGGSNVSQKWKYTADGDIYTSPAIATDGTIYFATLNGTVYALTDNGSSPTKKWSWTASGNSSITSSIALAKDGSLYFAAYDHKLHALTSNGAEKWAFTLGDEVRASSPAVGADGTIYVGCYDSDLYAIYSDGTLQRVYATAKTIRSSPAIANNRLYCGSADGKLYAFDIGQSAIASSWPMFHQNAARTGRLAVASVSITTQPQSKTLASGSALNLSVVASGPGVITYQWYKDGVALSGATSSTYSVSSVSAADAGSYTVKVTGASTVITSSTAVVSVVPAGTALTTFANIATRAYCSTANKVTIGGFVVSGSTSKRVLVRAVGPTLTTQGLGAAEVLADPTIDVYQGSTVIASNDDWGTNGNVAEITSTAQQIGASAFATSDTKSAALLLTLSPGVYTFIVNGKASTSGIVLLEVYDADVGLGSKFVNIASRAYATTGNGVAIGGFVISGSVAKNVLVRAVGPTLVSQGISQSEVLVDPMIELHQGSPVIASNDDWSTNANAAEIVSTGSRIGATPFAASDTTSAALLLTLQPGVYSFIASGKSSTSGIVLVEIYDAD